LEPAPAHVVIISLAGNRWQFFPASENPKSSSSDFRPKRSFSLKKNEGLGMLPIIGGKKIKLRENSSQMKT
jgi:hypothetical protein